MKTQTHPAYGPVIFKDRTTGHTYEVLSTLGAEGEEPVVLLADVTADSHPFWTGNKSTVDVEGRVAAFERRYGKR